MYIHDPARTQTRPSLVHDMIDRAERAARSALHEYWDYCLDPARRFEAWTGCMDQHDRLARKCYEARIALNAIPHARARRAVEFLFGDQFLHP